jgi:hypothetical protein
VRRSTERWKPGVFKPLVDLRTRDSGFADECERFATARPMVAALQV